MIPDSDAARIGALPQVAEVMPVKLLMTSCRSGSDVLAVHGVDKERFTAFRKYEVSPDALTAFRADTSGALVGDRIASRYGWMAGQNVVLEQLGDISINIRGVFTTQGTTEDFVVLTGRRFLQEAADQQGVSNRVMIRLADGADPGAVSRTIDALPLTIQTVTQAEEAFLAASLDQLADLVSVSRVVIAVIVAVILIAVGNVISMATRERSREFGILRTLGFRKPAILSVVLLEGLIQALVGGVVGCLLVQTALWAGWIQGVSSCGFTVAMTAGPRVWAVGVGLVCLAGTLGSFAPAWSAARLNIVTAIRRED